MIKESEIKDLEKEVLNLKKVICDLEKENIRLKLLAEYDYLTGLYNRRGFIKETEKFLKTIRKENTALKERRSLFVKNFSLIFADLDNLKKINDIYNHKTGDDFIKTVADIFNKNTRRIDIVGRWGGDEFVIGLININETEAKKIANKLKNIIAEIAIQGVADNFVFSASFGIISVLNGDKNKNNIDLHELVEKADMAMYEAKKNKGKGIIFVYDETGKVLT